MDSQHWQGVGLSVVDADPFLRLHENSASNAVLTGGFSAGTGMLRKRELIFSGQIPPVRRSSPSF